MSEVKWNDSQQQAIDARNTSLIVSAAAGSGKTAVLVQRLLEILSDTENKVSADKIAVVTFTNDAAAQMKQRLTESLACAIENNPQDQWLIRQQSLINSAKISTIHTFCFDMIRDNIRELDVSTDFKIIDDTEEKLLISKALDTVFEKLYSAENTAEIMNRLVDFFSKNERKEAGLEEVILEIYNFLMSTPFPEKWMKQAIDNYTCSEDDIEKNPYCVKYLESAIAKLENYSDQQSKALAAINELALNDKALAKLKTYKNNAENMETAVKQISEAVNKLKDTSAKWDDRINVSFDPLAKVSTYKKIDTYVQIHRFYLEKTLNIFDELNKFTTKNIIRDFKIMKEIAEYLSAVISMLIEEISSLKSEKNVLSFSDAEQLAIKLLCTSDEKGEPVRTKLAEELSEYYKLIMIDEFQDANENQNLIFRLLSHNGTAEENGDNLFVVGDIKQSIYGFRLANPAIFRNAFKNADAYTDEYTGTNARIVFNRNYRSSSDVIDFTNYVFENIMTEELGGVDYTGDEKLVLGADYPPKDRTTVLMLATPGGTPTPKKADAKKTSAASQASAAADTSSAAVTDTAAPTAADTASADGKTADTFYTKETREIFHTYNEHELEAYMVAEKIASMIGNTEIGREGSVRKCFAADFCILLRDNYRGQFYKAALEKHGISAIIEEQEDYLEETEVTVIMNMLRVIDNPMCDIPMASVLLSPIFMLTADELAQIRLMGQKKLYTCINKFMKNAPDEKTAALHSKLEYFTEILTKLRFDASSMELPKLIRTIYDRTDYISSVQALSGGAQKCANLRQLLVYAETYSDVYDGGLQGFIYYIDDIIRNNKDLKRAAVSKSVNCVSIKTIHKSKGLEYPFVFLCGTGKKFNERDEKKMFILNNELGLAFTIQDHKKLCSYEPLSYSLVKNTVHHNMLSEEMRLLYVAMTRAKEQLFISMINKTTGTGKLNLLNRIKFMSGLISDKITPDVVSEAECMRDWLTMAFVTHPSFKKYADEYGVSDYSTLNTNAKLSVINAIYTEKNKENTNAQTTEEPQEQTEVTAETDVISASDDTVKLLSERFAAADRTITEEAAAKLTITEIAKESSEVTFNMPDFSQKYSGLTAAQAGTAMHTFMQYVNFEAAEQSEEAVRLEADRMEDMGILSDIERRSLDTAKLYRFFTSDIYQRMKNSGEIYREKKFLVKISELSLDDKLAEEYNNNNSMLQGIADCFFVEDGEIVLIDYKTDRVSSEQVLVERYSLQLRLYSAAFEKIRNQKVKEAYLYSFGLGRKVCIPLG